MRFREFRNQLGSVLQESDQARWILYIAVLLGAGLLQFWDARLLPFYNDDFVYFDHIERAKGNLTYLFSPEHESSGRFTTTLFFLVGKLLWSESTTPFHLTLIVVNCLTVFVLAWALFEIGVDWRIAATTGIIFLFNVSHYEVVYWLSCLSYLGCMTFGCLAMVHYWRYMVRQVEQGLLYCSLLILVAVSFHASAIIFVFLGGYFALRRGAPTSHVLKTIWIPLLLCVGYTTLIYLVYSNHPQNRNVAQIDEILHVIHVVAAYMGRTYLSPHWLTRTYIEGPDVFDTIIGASLIGVMVILMVYRRCTPLDALVWSLVALPIFGGSPDTEYRSRYFYFASVGPSLLFAWGLLSAGDWLSAKLDSRLGVATIGVGLTVLLAVSSVHLTKTIDVFKTHIGRYHIAADVDHHIGVSLLREGLLGTPEFAHRIFFVRYGVNIWFTQIDRSETMAVGAVFFPEDSEIVLLNEVAGYIRSGKNIPNEFVAKVKRKDKRTIGVIATSLNNAGSFQWNRRDYEKAERLYANALRIYPNYVKAITSFANTLLYQGRLNDALTVYERYFEISDGADQSRVLPGLKTIVASAPHDLKAKYLLSWAYALEGNADAAVSQLKTGRSLAPEKTNFALGCIEIAKIFEGRNEFDTANRIRSLATKIHGAGD